MGARIDPGQDDAVLWIGAGLDDSGSGEQLVVTCGQGTAALVPRVEMAQLHQQYRGLQGIQAAVPADLLVVVADLHAVGAEAARAPGDGGARSW